MNLSSSLKILKMTTQLEAEIGTPGARNTGTGNLVEPISRGEVPSLKKKQKRPIRDEEIEEMEESIMPDKAKERKKAEKERIGRSANLQQW